MIGTIDIDVAAKEVINDVCKFAFFHCDDVPLRAICQELLDSVKDLQRMEGSEDEEKDIDRALTQLKKVHSQTTLALIAYSELLKRRSNMGKYSNIIKDLVPHDLDSILPDALESAMSDAEAVALEEEIEKDVKNAKTMEKVIKYAAKIAETAIKVMT